MNRTIAIPSNPNKITIGMIARYANAETVAEKLSAVTGKDIGFCKNISAKKAQDIFTLFEYAINKGEPKFDPLLKIKLPNKPFWKRSKVIGFIPNFDNITVSEVADYELLRTEPRRNMVKIACILFRPVKDRVNARYNLEPYDSDSVWKYSEWIEQIPVTTYAGAFAFFLSLRDNCVSRIPDNLETLTNEVKDMMKQEQIPLSVQTL
jgi:hypothetical protein